MSFCVSVSVFVCLSHWGCPSPKIYVQGWADVDDDDNDNVNNKENTKNTTKKTKKKTTIQKTTTTISLGWKI